MVPILFRISNLLIPVPVSDFEFSYSCSCLEFGYFEIPFIPPLIRGALRAGSNFFCQINQFQSELVISNFFTSNIRYYFFSLLFPSEFYQFRLIYKIDCFNTKLTIAVIACRPESTIFFYYHCVIITCRNKFNIFHNRDKHWYIL